MDLTVLSCLGRFRAARLTEGSQSCFRRDHRFMVRDPFVRLHSSRKPRCRQRKRLRWRAVPSSTRQTGAGYWLTPFPAWPGAFDARDFAVASLVQAFGAQGYAVSLLRPEHSEAASVNARKRFAFSPRHSFLRCPIVRSVDDFPSCRFSLTT